MDEEILFDLETDLKICNPTPTYLNVEKELFQNLKKFFQIVLDLFCFPNLSLFYQCGYPEVWLSGSNRAIFWSHLLKAFI